MHSRESVKAGGPSCEQVRRLVAEGRLEEAIAAFLDSPGTDEPELVDQATLLSGRFSRLAADENQGRLTREAADVERQRIAELLLKLVRAAERHVAPEPDVMPLSAKEKQARAWYLKALRRKLETLLKASIHKARLLDLGIQDTQEATHVPWMYQGTDAKSFSSIQEALEDYEGRLLVLGAPGSGKTTTLQHIALRLIEKAEKDDAEPIPVLVNLSKFRMDAPTPLLHRWLKFWRDTTPSSRFEMWLADEIAANPDVSHAVALKWIREERVAALLDGLDEVNDEQRADLVQLLNQTFLLDHRHSFVVVSSRIDEYEPLRGQEQKRLQLYGAVTLTPLSVDQIRTYLSTARADALAQAIEKDASLMELARTPLTLSMMTLAYADLPESAIQAELPLTDRRHHLMEAYVSRMLQRNERRERGSSVDTQRGPNIPTSEYRYSPEQINKYLGWLAVRLSVRMQTACSVGQFHSFLSRPPAAGQPSSDRWATSLTLACFTAVTHALVALSLVPDAPSALLAAAIIAGGTMVFALRSNDALKPLKFAKSSRPGVVLSGAGVVLIAGMAGFFFTLTLVARSLSTLAGGRLSPLAMGLLLLSALLVVTAGTSWRFFMGTVISLAAGAALSVWLRSGWQAGLVLPVTLLVGQTLTSIWIVVRETDETGQEILGWWGALLPPTFITVLVGGLAGGLFLLPASTWYLQLGTMVMALSLLVPTDRTAVSPSLAFPVCAGGGALLAGRDGAVVAAALFAITLMVAYDWREHSREKQSFSARVYQYVSGRLADLEAFVERWVLSPLLLFVLSLARVLPAAAPSFFRYCGRALLLKSAEREVEFIHRRLRDYFALRELMPRLQAPDMSVRLAAIRDVGYQGASAVETLAELASGQDPEVRTAAVSALGHITAPEVGTLLQRALEDNAPQVRLAAIRGYRGISTEILGRMLMRAASDESVEVQLAAVEAAANAEHPEALAIIERVLIQRSDLETLRRVLGISKLIIAQLHKHSRDMGAFAQVLPRSTGVLLRRLADEDDDQIRVLAMKLIDARHEFAELEHAIRRLEKEKSAEVRELACSMLAKLYQDIRITVTVAKKSSSNLSEEMRRIREVLIAALADSSDNVRVSAIRSVGRLREPQDIEAIRPLLKSGMARVRSAAARVLGRQGDLRDEPALRLLLQDTDENVRAAAAEALGRVGAAASIRSLVKALGDRAPKVRRAAAAALGSLKATEATKALKKVSHDRDPSVRIDASIALQRINGDPAALFELTRHPAASVRSELATALGEIARDEQVTKVLTLLLNDSDKDVRREASAALGKS